MTAQILTVTVNPALDVTTSVAELAPQQKLRCDAPRYDPGGGGVNVSRAIKELGGDSHAFVVLGGATGVHHRQLLEMAGVDLQVWPAPGETRFSMTVMEKASGKHFRFVLPGPAFTPNADQELLAGLSQIIGRGFRYVVASGSLPPGIPDDFYGRLSDLARAHDCRVILDTHGPALRAALPHRPYLIRLNHLEAAELVGTPSFAPADALADQLFAQAGAEIVIVTRGEEGAFVATGQRRFSIRPPAMAVRSTVGAGDSFVAALTLGFSRGWPLEDCVRYGVAAAAAAVTTEATQLCQRDEVNRIFAEMGGALDTAA